MFKSLVGASMGPLKSQVEVPAGIEESQDNEGNEPAKSRVNGSPMKRGRKKLTSMMSRLRTGGKKNYNNSNCHTNPEPSDGDDNEDDEDETYETAEELCRKMSLGEALEPSEHIGKYEDQKIKQQIEMHKNRVTSRRSIGTGSNVTTTSINDDDKKDILPEEQCDIPTFLQTHNCDRYLIDECRRLLKERYAKNPESFYEADYQRMLQDDWTVTRFLLRRRQDPRRTAKLMEECGKFRKTYKMSEAELWEFPIEFHRAGGLFKYAPDRVGNVTMYMRVKMYRRVPEISDVFKAFILCVLEQCDVANNGRGTAVIFDLSGCGLQNVDLGFLSWLLSSFRNYCPKGVSYILVYNLPWILNATCKLAMTWMSASNRRSLRFCHGDEIETFIARENLPDYLGGLCKINYRKVPAGSKPATEVCHRFDLTPKQALKIKELFKEYINEDDDQDQTQAEDEQAASGGRPRDKHGPSQSPRESVKKSLQEMGSSSCSNNNNNSIDTEITTNGAGEVAKPVVDFVSRTTKFMS